MAKKQKKDEHQEYPDGYAGLLSPQACELERAILGAVMLEKGAFDMANLSLSPEMFYNSANAAVFRAMQVLSDKRRPIDMLTVLEALKETGELGTAGGPAYIASLTAGVAGSAHMEFHCLVVRDKYIRRRLIEICHEETKLSFDETEDLDDTVSKLNTDVESVMELMAGGKDVTHVSKSARQSINQMYQRIEDRKKGIQPGITTGFADLNRLLNGWQNQKLIILAARPGGGKTSLAIQFARKAAARGHSVVFFSLEMGETELTDKMIIAMADVGADGYFSGAINTGDCDRAETAMSTLSSFPIYIEDTPVMTVQQIINKARLLKKQGKCDMVVIDYLQLIKPVFKAGRNRENEVSEITRMLKVHAKELNVPFIVLCQMNRDIESGKNELPARPPRLSDLRESGSIEQDADIVIFVYRPNNENKSQGNKIDNILELYIRKHRGGKTGKVLITHNESMTAFFDYDRCQHSQPYETNNPDRNFEPQHHTNIPF
jgi:replicative DNA helicase